MRFNMKQFIFGLLLLIFSTNSIAQKIAHQMIVPYATSDIVGFTVDVENIADAQIAAQAGVAGGLATLDGSSKVPLSQIPASLIGAVNYQSTWDADSNSPTLADGPCTKGHYYVVNVSGTTVLDLVSSWALGDIAICNGDEWEKIDNTDSVTSVNGLYGTVVIGIAEISGLQAALDLKAPLASPALTGTPTAPTASQGNNSTQISTTAYVDTGLALKSNIASPIFTGTPEAPTAAGGTNTTQLATTAFVNGEVSTSAATKITGPLSGDVTTPSNTSGVTTIAANAIGSSEITDGTVAMTDLANLAARSVIGRASNSTGVPAAISCTSASNAVFKENGSGALTCATITNVNIDAAAAIAWTKMLNLTVSRVLVSDSNGDVSVASTTTTQLSYLDATSSVQNQFNAVALAIDNYRKKYSSSPIVIDNMYSSRLIPGDAANSGYAGSGPTIYYVPVRFNKVFDITRLMVEINGGGGSFVQLGLYSINSDLLPRSRIINSGDIDISGGAGTYSYTNPLDAQQPGLYFLAIGVKDPVDIRSINRTHLENILGMDGSVTPMTMITMYREDGTYELPSTATVDGFEATDVPEIFFGVN
jgi:hypothetical protein